MKLNSKSIVILASLLILICSPVFGQDDQTESYFGIQPRTLIDAPTAMTLPRGSFDLALRVFPHGGIIGATNIGLSNRFMLGISYGAVEIIADEGAIWNPKIEFNIKLRLIDEAYYLPAIAVGFVSQGYGSYSDENKRYEYKSKGFYVVASRSLYFYNMALGGHAGINFTTDDEDGDNDPSLFFGIDTQFNNDVAILAEYDLALNDDKGDDDYGRGRGYLNFSVKWLYSENLELEVIFKNLLNNQVGTTSFSRGLRFTYVEYF